jgi:hypothetical protein
MADHTPTFGDLCSAIAEGSVAATIDDAMYQLSAFELRRYLNRFRSLPDVCVVLDQSASPHSNPDSWSAPAQISLAQAEQAVFF